MRLVVQRLLWRLGWADAPGTPRQRVATYPALVVCEECDLVHRRVDLALGEQSLCVLCGALLGRGHRRRLPRGLQIGFKPPLKPSTKGS